MPYLSAAGLPLLEATGRTDCFDESFASAVSKILEVWETEQNHEHSAIRSSVFDCVPSDTLPSEGRGTPVGYTRDDMDWLQAE